MSYPSRRAAFQKRERQTPYAALRNGLAHEYSPKVPFEVVMFGTPPVAIVRRAGRYVLVVEAYLRDFRSAARHIYQELMALPSPGIPPPD